MTVVKEINEPRLPSLRGKMAARKAVITTWGAADIGAEAENLGLEGSPTKVVRIFTPPSREGGEMLEGEPHEIAAKLAEKLKDLVIEAAS
jgi:electron transfer flavoprotein beta subunit